MNIVTTNRNDSASAVVLETTPLVAYVCTEGMYTVELPVPDTEPEDDIEKQLATLLESVKDDFTERVVADIREELSKLLNAATCPSSRGWPRCGLFQ